MSVDSLILSGVNSAEWFGVLILLTTLWTVPWKAIALWRAARRDSKIWFVVLLLVNTLAVLEILYLNRQLALDGEVWD